MGAGVFGNKAYPKLFPYDLASIERQFVQFLRMRDAHSKWQNSL